MLRARLLRAGGDAAFARPELHQYLETKGYLHAIRLIGNDVLEGEIELLLTHPVGPPRNRPIVWHRDFLYPAASVEAPRCAVAKVAIPRRLLAAILERISDCGGPKLAWCLPGDAVSCCKAPWFP